MSQTPADDAPVSTGDARVDEALRATESLETQDVSEHPAAYEHVHRVLRDSLAGTPPAPDDGHRR